MVDFPLAKSHVHSCLATENAARSDARDTGGWSADAFHQICCPQLSHKMIPRDLHDLHDVDLVYPDWVEDIDIEIEIINSGMCHAAEKWTISSCDDSTGEDVEEVPESKMAPVELPGCNCRVFLRNRVGKDPTTARIIRHLTCLHCLQFHRSNFSITCTAGNLWATRLRCMDEAALEQKKALQTGRMGGRKRS